MIEFVPRELCFIVFWVMFLAPGILAAQQQIVPNDQYFGDQISFRSPGGAVSINRTSARSSPEQYQTHLGIDLDITRAWSITTGSKSVVVAILDDGFCYMHPDLKDNIWKNPGESGSDANGFSKEANGVDDDHNGYIDDVVGWDFVFNSPDVDCHVFDGRDSHRIAPNWHSMGAMGIIGAKGNNGIGVAGINWNVSMMLLRIGVQGAESNRGRLERVIDAIHYAADNGARIINWSGFVIETDPGKLAELRRAIEYAASKNVLVVVCAGNYLTNLDDDHNCDDAPQCFEAGNLIKVAEVDFGGNLYISAPSFSGSNYGAKRVDIAAIGLNYSTDVSKGGVGIYGLTGGTSNAAPVVSGVAALMLSVNPVLTAPQLKEILLRTAKPLPTLRGKVRCEGIVDAYAAVKAAEGFRPNQPLPR